jgi:hypothetical protein
MGALIANATKNPRNSQRWVFVLISRFCRSDDGSEHEQPADQAVEQELHRRVRALGAAVAPDQEVHRDEHRLEEHVEHEDVGRGEDADRHRLEQQHQGEVALDGPLVALALVDVSPGGADDDRGEYGRQPDQDQADAVHPERPVHPEGRDPLVGLGELVGLAAAVEAEEEPERHQEREDADPECGQLGPPLAGPRQEHDQQCADRGKRDQRAEDGSAVHQSITTARAATTSAAPPNIDRAYERT